MALYVSVDMSGVNKYQNIIKWLRDNNIRNVEYYTGGLSYGTAEDATPHLKFKDEADAFAFVLVKGGKMRKTISENSLLFWSLIRLED